MASWHFAKAFKPEKDPHVPSVLHLYGLLTILGVNISVCRFERAFVGHHKMLNTQRIQVGIRTPNITENVGSWSDVFLNNWNQGFFCSVFHTVHDKCIGPSSTMPDIHIFAPCVVVRPNRLWCISTLPESTMCGRLRCTSSLKSSRRKEAQSTPDFSYEIPAGL